MSAQIISLPRWGATAEEWATFDVILGLTDDLLPVVSNPNAEISPDSTMKQLGKTPSKYNSNGKAVGIAKWTEHHASAQEVERWSRNPDIGICLQTRSVRALDVDVGDPEEASDILAVLLGALEQALPERIRSNAAKFLCLFRLPGDMPKRVIKTQHGMIELLGTGQQCIVAGTHPSGVRYEWVGGLPDEIPELSLADFEDLWAALVEQFAVEPPIEAKTATKSQRLADAPHNDPTARHLLDNGWVKSFGKDGSLNITCAFEAEHTTEGGAESATRYFPAHTGGYERGHFHCLHAHCAHRTDEEYREAIGMPNDDFADFDVVGPDVDSQEPDKEAPKRFAVVPACEFAAGVPPAWLIKRVLPAAGLAVVFGDSGSGKTFFMLDLVAAVVRGLPWRDLKTAQGGCVYIVAEGAGGFRNRLRAYAEHEGIPLSDLPIGVIGDAPNFMLAPDVKDVLKAIKAYGHISMIVVDTFAQVMPGANENSGDDVGKALAHCKVLHKHTGALVVLVHHSGKDSSKGARGWSGLRAAADAEIEISRLDNDRVATITKLKDGDDGTEYGFKLQTVVLGQDEDGDDITSCVLQHTNAVPKAQRKKEPKGDIQVLAWRLFNDLVGLSDGAEGVRATDLWDACVAQLPEEEGKRDTRMQRVKRAVDGLVAAGRIFVDGARLFAEKVEND